MLDLVYVGTPEQHTHLLTLILNAFFGPGWEVIGESNWPDPRWPALYWSLLLLAFWTLLTGLLYRRRLFLKI